MEPKTIETKCPCCESKLTVDVKTGEVIWEERKAKPNRSLSDMVKGLDSQRQEQENLFRKSSQSHRERDRILDEKFKQAQKKADKSGDRPLRDFDLD
ncbi:MAG: 2-nitropropane dioxygenase [Nitrospinaceae bacterium]|nr:2-nitropropane dioxygenase [Nitrospinaceae bacterium]NIR56372.1 2-nitropropane dioxygenase [Nitrospinaceae bacterium]NIS86834.1 2-nitropropane dioxygenase [Nitrospinaceae bacterium]NIT83670.1 2-nitropropane dioxygenase [Nitrospinaceae bacterium]NIU45868.1 2-nitropropane dioxygenase [Nitrospinaceae bacterium]